MKKSLLIILIAILLTSGVLFLVLLFAGNGNTLGEKIRNIFPQGSDVDIPITNPGGGGGTGSGGGT